MTMNKHLLDQAKGFIYTDIQRELSLASLNNDSVKSLDELHVNPGGGNFLCALALFCYIEFAGKLKYNLKKSNGDSYSSGNFNAFFDDLGTSYKLFRSSFPKSNDVYDIFRCGLAHEYYVKQSCGVYMFGNKKYSGIGKTKSGNFYIVIQNLFDDFKKEFNQLK